MSAEIELDHYRPEGSHRLGGRIFSRDVPRTTEQQYDAFRRQAQEQVDQRKSCMQRAHEAYERGDGAAAKELSNQGKWHAAEADRLFGEASQVIFVANNPNSKASTIDLHGQYVEEAKKLVVSRIHEDRQEGKTHLHVIVGKGNHSVGHIQKLKPAIEDLCQNLGLQYATEENEGRIYVNLQGGNATHAPPQHSGHGGHPAQHHGDQQPQYYPGQQQQHHSGQNQEEQYDEMEKFFTKLFKKYCCTVM